MTDAEPLFIDTNVLIYANVAGAPFHEQALKVLTSAYQSKQPLWISRQVLREFIAARTRPQTFAQPSTPEVVIERGVVSGKSISGGRRHHRRNQAAHQASGGFQDRG